MHSVTLTCIFRHTCIFPHSDILWNTHGNGMYELVARWRQREMGICCPFQWISVEIDKDDIVAFCSIKEKPLLQTAH